ncbi:RrF2 family transcriptional regulator [Candidatus Leptofilum sp.]|uniref:RrF2 family transcriptional regulator n=1 Tax=Candidatus Leptofilum sp. TaxID=3241576 RepID=UPI003B5BD1CA
MFQISRRADYAVRIMIELGMQAEGMFLSARHISAKTAVPKAFLHKITADLVRAGLIETQTGPYGGLSLQKPCSEINLLHVIEAIEGPVCLNICLIRPQECNRDRFCPAHDVWGKLQLMIVNELQAKTLADLVAEAKRLQMTPRVARIGIPYLEVQPASGVVSGGQS